MQSDPVSEQADHLEEPQAKLRLRLLRYAGIAVISGLLAWPIGYLMMRRAEHYDVLAGSHAPNSSGASTAQLEAAARANPTETNRLRLSWAYLKSNRPGPAIPLLLSILAQDKNNADAWNNLCVAHTLAMSYNLAIEDCDQALRIKPDYQLARNNLNWAEGKLKKIQKTIAVQEQTAPSARDTKFYLSEGFNFLHIGGYRQAIKAWQRVLDLDPRNAFATNNIGVAYMAMHQPARAVVWFQKAISLDPRMQRARNNLAWGRGELKKPLR